MYLTYLTNIAKLVIKNEIGFLSVKKIGIKNSAFLENLLFNLFPQAKSELRYFPFKQKVKICIVKIHNALSAITHCQNCSPLPLFWDIMKSFTKTKVLAIIPFIIYYFLKIKSQFCVCTVLSTVKKTLHNFCNA